MTVTATTTVTGTNPATFRDKRAAGAGVVTELVAAFSDGTGYSRPAGFHVRWDNGVISFHYHGDAAVAFDPTDAARIISLADAADVPVRDAMYAVMDGDAAGTELYDAIRAAFSTDDGFDDLMHEIDHELGDCIDGSDDCPLTD